MIERTYDMALVNKILRSPGIWENICGKEPVDNFEAPADTDIHYLLVTEGDDVAGLFILHPGEHGLKIHANMLPDFRGEIALRAAAEVLDYGFKMNDTIYAEISDDHPNVIKFAERFLQPTEVNEGMHTLMLRVEP